MDDESGWEQVLLGMWSARVRSAVVDRIERATVGRRGLLVRTLGRPDRARFAWTEELHELVLRSIREETGADLDELGSQAAWACYDEVWNVLAQRWATGERLARIHPDDEPAAEVLLRQLPVRVAACAGADTGTHPVEALRLDGRMLLDVEGLLAVIARDDGALTTLDRRRIDALIARAHPQR